MKQRKKRGRDFYALPVSEIRASQPPTEYFTLLEAAQLLRLSPWTLRKFIHLGELACIRIGRRVILARTDLIEFLERRKVRGNPQGR